MGAAAVVPRKYARMCAHLRSQTSVHCVDAHVRPLFFFQWRQNICAEETVKYVYVQCNFPSAEIFLTQQKEHKSCQVVDFMMRDECEFVKYRALVRD